MSTACRYCIFATVLYPLDGTHSIWAASCNSSAPYRHVSDRLLGLARERGPDLRGHRLIRCLQQQRHIPHLLLAECVLERRHSGKADAVLHLPVGFTGLVIAYTHDVPLSMLLPQLRRLWIHPLGEVRVTVRRSVASRTLLRVDLRAGQVHLRVTGKWRLLHLVQHSSTQRHSNDLRFEGKRLVRCGDG